MKKNIKFIIGVVLIVLCFYFNLGFDINFDFKTNTIHQKVQLILILISSVVISGLGIFLLNDKNKLDVHKKYLIISVFLGIFYILLTPILHGSDEGAHFFKVYSIVTGFEDKTLTETSLELVPSTIVKCDLPNTLISGMKAIGQKIDSSDLIKTDKFLGANLYTFFSYLPYLIPMFICQIILKMDLFFTVIFGRIFAFICGIMIMTYAIKIMPKRKDFFALLCLTPVMLAGMTIYTADLMTNATIILFIAIWYKAYEEKKKMTKKDILLISLLGVFAAFAKIVYILIFLILFLLPEECFECKKEKNKSLIFIFLIILIAVLINIFVVGNNMLDAYPEINAQKNFIFSNPLKYLKILFTTILKDYSSLYIFTTNGGFTLIHNGITISEIVSFIYTLILIISLLIEGEEKKLTKKGKILISSIITFVIVILYTSLYIQYTAKYYGIGNTRIYGVQPRYFIPIVAMLPIIPLKKKDIIEKKFLWLGVLLIDFIFILNIIVYF